MFGIDSSEFLLIAVVALLVIGPKDLPRVMRLVGGWVGRGRAMTRHLRAGFDTMMREAEIEEMQKQWAKQNADIMAATQPAAVGAHAYDAVAGEHVTDAVVGEHVYDHPGALPTAETPTGAQVDCHPRESGDPGSQRSEVMGPRFRGDDSVIGGTDVGAPMTGPLPSAQALAAAHAPVTEPVIPLEPLPGAVPHA